MPTDPLRRSDTFVSCLRSAIVHGSSGLSDVPGLLKQIIQENMWRDRFISQTGEMVHFDRFLDFVQTKPLEGIGSDIKTLQRLCGDDPEALDLLDKATQGKHGGDRSNLDNVKVDDREEKNWPDGSSSQYALRRLRKDRPDLHAKVLAKELTPNAAMIEAGFRKKTILVPLDPEQDAWLDEISAAEGISRSDLVRMAIDKMRLNSTPARKRQH